MIPFWASLLLLFNYALCRH